MGLNKTFFENKIGKEIGINTNSMNLSGIIKEVTEDYLVLEKKLPNNTSFFEIIPYDKIWVVVWQKKLSLVKS